MKGECGSIGGDFFEEMLHHQKAGTWDEVIAGICKLISVPLKLMIN